MRDFILHILMKIIRTLYKNNREETQNKIMRPFYQTDKIFLKAFWVIYQTVIIQ